MEHVREERIVYVKLPLWPSEFATFTQQRKCFSN